MNEHSNLHACGESDTITIVGYIKHAGSYRMGGNGPGCFCIGLRSKPCWFHRLMVRVLLGWVWEDAK